MKYEAVIFDLFGTLTDMSPWFENNKRILTHMANEFSLPPEDFRRLWHETAYDRNIGIYPSIEDNVEYICKALGIQANDTKIRFTAKLRHDFTASMMKPREDALNVLSRLKASGYKTALISNCSPGVPSIWKDTAFAPLFDVAVFSCSVGLMKPDLRIYQIATEKLAVEPQSCLYIGDGTNQELTGAAQIGMHPVLIRVPNKDSTDAQWEDSTDAEQWDGPVISSLSEVLDLVR